MADFRTLLVFDLLGLSSRGDYFTRRERLPESAPLLWSRQEGAHGKARRYYSGCGEFVSYEACRRNSGVFGSL